MSENDTYKTPRERLNKIISSFTVYKDFLFDFKQYKRAHPDWNKRSQIEKLDDEKSALFYNYQTLMCKDYQDRLDRAKEENAQALEKEPQNFIALCHAVELALNSQGTPAHCIEEYLGNLEKVSTNTKEIMLVRTEVAFSYNRLHPMFYEKAIKVYEDAFNELPQHYITDGNDPGFHYKISRAKIGLGKLYNKVSTRGMANAYNSSPYQPSTFYMKAKTLLLEDVINGHKINGVGWGWAVKKVNGLAWTELAIAADKYIHSRDENVAIEDSMKPERCFREALECMPKGSYQLEKYGQFKRMTAKTLDDYRECIELLKRALDAEPDRYTTMYEIGKTFKRMWEISNDGFDDREAEEGVVEEEEEEKGNGGDSGADSKWKTNGFPCAPNNLPKPTHKNKHNMPKQYFQNPNKTELHDDYLLESQKYFKMAKETGNCSSCIHTIELARTYISQGDTTTAELLFTDAEQMELNVMHAAYLFEQRALFLKEPTHQDVSHDLRRERDEKVMVYCREDVSHELRRERDEKVMFYCRECIRYHAECKSHLSVAFHELHELLYRKTQEKENKDNSILQREYMILFNAINKSKNIKDIITNLTINRKAVNEIRDLINELYDQIDHDNNSSTALTYLTILHEAGKLARVKDPIATTLGISSRAAYVCSYPEHILSNSYTWLMKIKYPEIGKMENSLFMVVMSNDDYVDRITDTLAKCNLPVRIFNALDQSDIGRYTSLEPDDISTLLIVDHPGWDSVNEESRKRVGKFLKKVKSKCFVSCKNEKVICFQQVDPKIWRFETEGQPSRNKAVKMGFELLNVLFMQ